jgi:hypothetical protein
MNPLLVCVATATLGFQYGWERLPDGRMEYVLQLDSAAIEALRGGQPLRSDIPADAGEIRAYRIQMDNGKDKPPRDIPLPKPVPPSAKPAKAPEVPVKPAAVESIQPPTPPLSWTVTILVLFASLGANAFLGWIAWGLRRRCRNAASV